MSPQPVLAPVSLTERYFTRVLIGIAITGMLPALYLGQYQNIDSDGWWHLFTATQDRWVMFLGEWKFEAHPPLHYLLLRFVAMLGHSHLVLRSIGIIAAAFSSYYIGIVGAKLYQHKASAILLSAAYTFTWNMIDLNCSVRGYPLALLFVLLAFNAYVDWTSDPAGSRAGRAIVRFGLWCVLALVSEYYLIFFLATCAAITTVRALVRPVFRAALIESVRSCWRQWAFTIISVSGLFLFFFTFHMIVNVEDQHYLEDFYYREDTSLGIDHFLLSNTASEASYFAPFNLDPNILLGLILLGGLPALVYFAFVRRTRPIRPAAIDAPGLVAMILFQMAVLSLVGKYPYGGEFRQQSLIAPFVFLSTFLLVDRIADALASTRVRSAAFAAIGLLIAGSFGYGAVVFKWDPAEPKSKEYSHFRETFPTPDALYADTTSAILYFAHKHNAKWTFLDRPIIDAQRMTVYEVDDGSGRPVRFIRNKRVGYFALSEPEMYRVLADVMRHQGLKSVILFYDGVGWGPDATPHRERSFRTLAPEAGLQYGRYSIGDGWAFIEFKLP
jgi:hypothetical protein